jgi:hypothetical protein
MGFSCGNIESAERSDNNKQQRTQHACLLRYLLAQLDRQERQHTWQSKKEMKSGERNDCRTERVAKLRFGRSNLLMTFQCSAKTELAHLICVAHTECVVIQLSQQLQETGACPGLCISSTEGNLGQTQKTSLRLPFNLTRFSQKNY